MMHFLKNAVLVTPLFCSYCHIFVQVNKNIANEEDDEEKMKVREMHYSQVFLHYAILLLP